MRSINLDKIKQLIKSIFWVCVNFYHFNKRLSSEHGISELRCYNVLNWHDGSYYFKCRRNNALVFIKTDYKFKLLANEVNAYNVLKKISKFSENILPLLFYDEKKFEFVAYEFTESKSLGQFMIDPYVSDVTKGIVCHKIIEILDCLSTVGIVHRDIKESNYFVTESKHLILYDFAFCASGNENNLFLELDVELDCDKKILSNMGRLSQIEPFHWDDAHGAYQMLSMLKGVDKTVVSELKVALKHRVGRLSYKLNCSLQ